MPKRLKGKILFVGNGFNLISDRGQSWCELLNMIAGIPNSKREQKLRSAKPFTLWYEEIKRASMTGNVKEDISAHLNLYLEPNSYHMKLMKLGFSNILTTNYDYNLESALGVGWSSSNTAKENYYSLFRRKETGNQYVWHIHGELDNVGSIMLGHEQYSGYMQKIRNFLTSGVLTKSKARNMRPYLSKYASSKSKTKGDVKTWVDLFMEEEVHIVGFSFDYTENHLWNLLMKKQRLKKIESNIGKVVFYRCSNHKQTIEEEAKLSILISLGAVVKDYVGTTYEKAYEDCIKDLAAL